MARLSKAYLIGMSLWFYGYFHISYLLVIIFSIVINYVFYTLLLKKCSKKKLLLILGLAFNLSLLAYYKYLDFIVTNINFVFHSDIPLLKILLPLGISFFTFQQISFLIDAYKQKIPSYDFLSYASYVSFFPQLIAGPIVLHSELIPQINDENKKYFDIENLSRGLYIFVLGLAKKVLIADTLGEAVTWGYQIVDMLDSTNAIIVILSYTFQIYFDFSGYCDMAIGIAKMFNIDLPINFDSPYRARTIGEFWKRWHMTLTRFFTQYVYIPLGGNRRGKLRTYLNVFLIFVLSGIWHGAGWTFILWGMMHGTALVIYRICRKYIDKIPAVINWIITFIFINITWVFFRAESVDKAVGLLCKVAKCQFGEINSELYTCFFNTDLQIINKIIPINSWCSYSSVIIWLGLAFLLSLKKYNSFAMMKRFVPSTINCILIVALFIWSICSLNGVSSFLYFNF